MNDLFNNELSTGDTVAFNAPMSKGLTTGVITNIKPEKVHIEYGSTLVALYGFETVKEIKL